MVQNWWSERKISSGFSSPIFLKALWFSKFTTGYICEESTTARPPSVLTTVDGAFHHRRWRRMPLYASSLVKDPEASHLPLTLPNGQTNGPTAEQNAAQDVSGNGGDGLEGAKTMTMQCGFDIVIRIERKEATSLRRTGAVYFIGEAEEPDRKGEAAMRGDGVGGETIDGGNKNENNVATTKRSSQFLTDEGSLFLIRRCPH